MSACFFLVVVVVLWFSLRRRRTAHCIRTYFSTDAHTQTFITVLITYLLYTHIPHLCNRGCVLIFYNNKYTHNSKREQPSCNNNIIYHTHTHTHTRRNSLLGCNLFHRNEIMKHIHIRVFGVVVCAIAAILHRPRICTHIYSLYNIIYTCLPILICTYEWYLCEASCAKIKCVFVWEMVAAWDAIMIEIKERDWGGDETNERCKHTVLNCIHVWV